MFIQLLPPFKEELKGNFILWPTMVLVLIEGKTNCVLLWGWDVKTQTWGQTDQVIHTV